MNHSVWVILGLLGLGLMLTVNAADAADLQVGDRAPGFQMPGSDGKTYTLDQVR